MSDHGEMLGDHGFYLKGPAFLRACCPYIPLIISNPAALRHHARQTHRVPCRTHHDLAPTFLELAGLPIHAGMQGRSLLPLLTGQTATHRSSMCIVNITTRCPSTTRKPSARCSAPIATSSTPTTIIRERDEPGELYDLQSDPTETRNLWSDPAALTIKATLLQRLCDRMAETVDPLPVRQSRW